MVLRFENLEKWLTKVIEETHSDALVRDAHIDQFIPYRNDSQQETFQAACQTINLVAKTLKIYDTKGVGVYLHLDLISDSKTLKKAPKDLAQLIELIDMHCVPEIVVYKPVESVDMPLNEFYRVPIDFRVDCLENNAKLIYKELRTHSKDKFQREINIVITINC